MQRTRNQYPSSLEHTHQSLFLSPVIMDYHQDGFDMPALDHDQHQQQQHLFLSPTVTSFNNEEESYDDLSNIDDQFMTLEIGVPQDWSQDPYQDHQPEEAMVVVETASFFADTSGSSSLFADPATNPYGYYSPCSQHLYCGGCEYYDDEHYDSIGGSIHLYDIPMSPADYTDASTSTSPKLWALTP